MFTTQMFIKQKFRNMLCLQNKIQNRKFTKRNKILQTRHDVYQKIKNKDNLCLQNKNLGQNKQMFTKRKRTDKFLFQNKTKVYKHVMFTKQNTKQNVYKTKLNFTNMLCLQNKIQNRKFTK